MELNFFQIQLRILDRILMNKTKQSLLCLPLYLNDSFV